MDDLIQGILGDEKLPDWYQPWEAHAAWARGAHPRLKGQAAVSFPDLLHHLHQLEKPFIAFALLEASLKDDPENYPEAFDQFCAVIGLASLDRLGPRPFTMDPLTGMGLPDPVALRFWKVANNAEGYATLLSKLIDQQVEDSDFWPCLMNMFLRPDLPLPEDDVSDGQLAMLDHKASQLFRQFGPAACHKGELPDDILDIVFTNPDHRIQNRPFVRSLVQMVRPDSWPKPLPLISSSVAKIYIIKSIFGMSEDGRFNEVPSLAKRRQIVNRAIIACPDFQYPATFKRHLLGAETIDLEGLAEFLSTDRTISHLLKELFLLRQLSGVGSDTLRESDCKALLQDRDFPITCLFDAFHALMTLTGELRDVLFCKLWPLTDLSSNIKDCLDWFQELFLDKNLNLESLPHWEKSRLMDSVLKWIIDFPEDVRENLWVNIIHLTSTAFWKSLSEYLRKHGRKLESAKLLANAVFDHSRDLWKMYPTAEEDKDEYHWERLVYGFIRCAAEQDPTSIPKWTKVWLDAAKESAVFTDEEALSIIFDEVNQYLSEHQLVSMSAAYDADLRQLVPEKLVALGTRKALAHAVLLHFDSDSDVAEAAETSFSEARENGNELFIQTGPDGRTPLPDYLLDRCRYFAAWAEAIGMKVLGRKTELSFFQKGLGRTHIREVENAVSIEVNPLPFLEGHPEGESVVKGLILHEIGHHYWDIGQSGFKSMRGIAASRNIREIFDILIDERLERAMCRAVPEAATWFDRLGSFAFAQELHRVSLQSIAEILEIDDLSAVQEMILDGRVPGNLVVGSNPPEVELTATQFFNLPDFSLPIMGFLYGLRGGMSPHHFRDPRIGRALKQVPGNLRSLSHREVLQVAFAVAEALEIDTAHTAPSMSQQLESVKEKLGQLGTLLQSILDRLGSFNRAAMEDMVSEAASEGPDETLKPDPKSSNSRIDLPEIRGPQMTGASPPPVSPDPGPPAKGLNLGQDITFDTLKSESALSHDPAAHTTLFQKIAPHIRRMRAFFENLVEEEREVPFSVRGSRLDMAAVRQLAVRPQIRILMGHETKPDPGAYIGILIDNSGSMAGEKSEKAKAFGMLIAEAAKGIREIEGHVNAFDDDTFIRLGDFRSHAIAALEARGGNNDAGGLARAAELALASRKRHRIIIMINDDSPTESTAESVGALVSELTRRHGLVLAQVAVDELQTGSFPHFVDFSELEFDAAIGEFGNLLRRLLRRR